MGGFQLRGIASTLRFCRLPYGPTNPYKSSGAGYKTPLETMRNSPWYRLGRGGGTDQRASHHAELCDDSKTDHSCLRVVLSEHLQPYRTIWRWEVEKRSRMCCGWTRCSCSVATQRRMQGNLSMVDPKDIKQDGFQRYKTFAGLNSRSALERAACGLCSYSVASQRKPDRRSQRVYSALVRRSWDGGEEGLLAGNGTHRLAVCLHDESRLPHAAIPRSPPQR